MNEAVDSATSAFDKTWGKLSGSERGDLLWKVADSIEQRAEELVSLEPIDMGKKVTALSTNRYS